MCSQNLGLFSSLSLFIKFQYITFQENMTTFHKLRNILWLKFSAWRSWKPEWGLKVSRNAFVGQFLSNAMHLSANEVFPSNLSFFNFENSFGWNGRQTLIMGSPWWQVNMFFCHHSSYHIGHILLVVSVQDCRGTRKVGMMKDSAPKAWGKRKLAISRKLGLWGNWTFVWLLSSQQNLSSNNQNYRKLPNSNLQTFALLQNFFWSA